MANELTLSVNGAKQVVSATPDTPLLFVLRNELKLTQFKSQPSFLAPFPPISLVVP
jgi:aerobic-type carbon monoxide dehydrogenase small subunit (CoxS/CutS family)